MTESSSTPRLLVVDDERDVVPGVAPFARELGFEVETSGNGRDAWQRIATFRPHAVVLDVGTPELDGLEVVRGIRRADPECLVIIMTGTPTVDTAIEAVKLGALDYLSKPIDWPRLEAAADHGAREHAPPRAAAAVRRRHRPASSSSTA